MPQDIEDWLVAWHRRGFTTEDARLIRSALLQDKARLRKGAHGLGRGTAAEIQNRRRFAARRMREIRKAILSAVPPIWPRKVVVQRKPIKEPILDALDPDRLTKWKPIYERPPSSFDFDLNSFSFVDDPAGTIKSLQDLARLESTSTGGRLNFLDAQCPDIGPYLVLQAMERAMLPIFMGGKISSSIQAVLDSVGLRRALGMTFERDSDVPIWPLPFRTRGPQGTVQHDLNRPQTSEHIASSISANLNDWLGTLAGKQLTPEGERLVLSMAGEAINNAERHSDPESSFDGSWSVAGFLSPRITKDEVFYRCHLALLSTGATISESIQTSAPATKAKMSEYVERHRSRFSGRLTSETLETVFALQDGVSRDADALRHGRGGTGLMDIAEFSALLGSTASREGQNSTLAIVSGSTCVTFRHPYLEGKRRDPSLGEDGLRQPRELWFNSENRPDTAPDGEFVRHLPARLAGTLVTMAWTIDPGYLQSNVNDPAKS